MTKTKKILTWLPLVFLGLPLIAVGGAKLASVPELHASFSAMGLPTWFGYFIGLAELSAGIAMFIPKLTALAGLGLIPILLGATYYHIAYEVPSPVPALIFLLFAIYAVVLRKQEAIWLPFK